MATTIKLVRRLANPRRVRRTKNARRRTTHRRINPALVLTLGAVNPKRRTTMNPKRKRKHNARRRRKHVSVLAFKRHNPRRRVHRRRHNPLLVRYTTRRRHHRRRNPVFSVSNWTLVAGGLTGVAATRFVGQIIPAGALGFAGSMGPLVRDAISAAVVSWGGGAVVGGGSEGKARFREGLTFGALMQVASTAIAAFVPSLRNYGFGISGMGYMMPAQFPVPQNPLSIPAPAPAPAAPNARVTANGLTRAFGTAL